MALLIFRILIYAIPYALLYLCIFFKISVFHFACNFRFYCVGSYSFSFCVLNNMYSLDMTDVLLYNSELSSSTPIFLWPEIKVVQTGGDCVTSFSPFWQERNDICIGRCGFTIMLKRLKPRAPDGGCPQNFESKDNCQHFCKQLHLYFCFGSTHVFFYAANTRSL